MIKFRCTACFHKHAVPDEYAGKTVRCSSCRGVMKVPLSTDVSGVVPSASGAGESDTSIPDLTELGMPATPGTAHATSAADELDEADEHLRQMREQMLVRKAIRCGVGILAAVLVLSAGYEGVLWGRQTMAARSMKPVVLKAIADADARVERYDFNGAASALSAALAEMLSRPLARADADALRAQVNAAGQRHEELRRDFEHKLAQGWKLVDGRLTPPEAPGGVPQTLRGGGQ